MNLLQLTLQLFANLITEHFYNKQKSKKLITHISFFYIFNLNSMKYAFYLIFKLNLNQLIVSKTFCCMTQKTR